MLSKNESLLLKILRRDTTHELIGSKTIRMHILQYFDLSPITDFNHRVLPCEFNTCMIQLPTTFQSNPINLSLKSVSYTLSHVSRLYLCPYKNNEITTGPVKSYGHRCVNPWLKPVMTTVKMPADEDVTRSSRKSHTEQTWRFHLHPSRSTSDLVLFDNTPRFCELSLKAMWEPWSVLCGPPFPRGLSALHSSGLAVMDCRVTFNLLGIVDDEIAVPYDGEVHCQVTDLHTLVHVLKSRDAEWGRECAREERKSEIQEIKRNKKKDRERQKGCGGGDESAAGRRSF